MPKVSEAYLEERRQQILDAATACFARKGFHQTTMEDIGNEAGVSPGVAYRYFESKEAIVEASIMSGVERWGGFLAEMQAGDFLQGLNTLTLAWFSRLEQPGIDTYYKARLKIETEYAQDSALAKRYHQMYEAGLDLFEEAVRHGQELGQLNPDLDTRALARILDALFTGLVLQWLADPNLDIWKYRETMMALFGGSFGQGEEREPD
jgi:AcrR family transcriptional regulator